MGRVNAGIAPVMALLLGLAGCNATPQTDESCYAHFSRNLPLPDTVALPAFDLSLGYQFDLTKGQLPAMGFAQAHHLDITDSRTNGDRNKRIAQAYADGLLEWKSAPKIVVFAQEPAHMVYLADAVPTLAAANQQLQRMCALAAKGLVLRKVTTHLTAKLRSDGNVPSQTGER